MSRVFFSRNEAATVGSFQYALALVEFTMSPEAEEVFERIGAGKEPAVPAGRYDEDQVVQLAYEVTSLVHETRHFVDTYSTLAGLSLLAGHLSLLEEFSKLVEAMSRVGMKWELPAIGWAKAPGCPPEVRNFVRRARAFYAGSEMFLAPFEPVEIDGHRDDLRLEIDCEGIGKIDAFPLRVMRMGQDEKLVPRTVIYPLGLEVLLEGNAHAVSRTMVGHYFPPEIDGRLQQRIRTVSANDAAGKGEQRVAQTTPPYMVTDLLITRSLTRRGVKKFQRDLVLALTDRVLATSLIKAEEVKPGVTAMHVDRVGGKLVDLLEAHEAEALRGGVVPDDGVPVAAAYEGMCAHFAAMPGWEPMKDVFTPWSAVEIWKRYLAKTVIVPLLRERLASGGRAMTTQEGFLKLLAKIGAAPARVINGKLLLGMPPRVAQAWGHCLMLGDTMRQLIHGDGQVFCPRAHATIPGVASGNFAFEGDCGRHQRLGCGAYRKRQTGIFPRCLFEDTLRVCGLQR